MDEYSKRFHEGNFLYAKTLDKHGRRFFGVCPFCGCTSQVFQVPCKQVLCLCKRYYRVVGSLEFCEYCNDRVACLTTPVVESY